MVNNISIAPQTCKAAMSLLIADFVTRASDGRWTCAELLVAISDAADTALLDLTE